MEVAWAPWRMELIESDSKHAGCIFCDFPAAADDEAHLIVHRTAHAYVILNKFPYNNGHVMVVPFQHVDDPGALPTEAFQALQSLLVQTLAVLRDVYRPQGMNVGMNLGHVAGAGIPGHIHWHVVPRWNGDTNFMPVLADVKVLPEHLERTRERLAAAFGALP